jgi:hypothetical protein
MAHHNSYLQAMDILVFEQKLIVTKSTAQSHRLQKRLAFLNNHQGNNFESHPFF